MQIVQSVPTILQFLSRLLLQMHRILFCSHWFQASRQLHLECVFPITLEVIPFLVFLYETDLQILLFFRITPLQSLEYRVPAIFPVRHLSISLPKEIVFLSPHLIPMCLNRQSIISVSSILHLPFTLILLPGKIKNSTYLFDK